MFNKEDVIEERGWRLINHGTRHYLDWSGYRQYIAFNCESFDSEFIQYINEIIDGKGYDRAPANSEEYPCNIPPTAGVLAEASKIGT